MASEGLLIVHVASLWPQKMVLRPSVSMGGKTPSNSSFLEPAGSPTYMEVSLGVTHYQTSHLKVIQQSLRKVDFLAKASAIAASCLRKSLVNMY